MNKNELLGSTLDMIGVIMEVSPVKSKRTKYDYFSDKLRQAASMNTLYDMFEKLCSLMECSIDSLQYSYNKATFRDFCRGANHPDAPSVLNWLRKNAVLAIMTCLQRRIWDETLHDGKGGYVDNDEFFSIVKGFDIPDVQTSGKTKPIQDFDINITATCLSPLSHGGDSKMGNATPFRRYAVMCDDGNTFMDLPAISGNSYRGLMRDLLSDSFLSEIGITPDKTRSPVARWFFHIIYEGGALKGVDKETKKITDKLGKNGAINPQGLYELRDMIPHISLLGAAVGNRMIEGRIYTNKLRPVCREWGFQTDITADSLLSWEFLTRKTDEEEYENHTGMIANTEVLKTGTVLKGGIDISSHTRDLEKSCLSFGLWLLKERGYLGAQNSKGIGRVDLQYKFKGEKTKFHRYADYLKNNREKIREYLMDIGAIEKE